MIMVNHHVFTTIWENIPIVNFFQASYSRKSKFGVVRDPSSISSLAFGRSQITAAGFPAPSQIQQYLGTTRWFTRRVVFCMCLGGCLQGGWVVWHGVWFECCFVFWCVFCTTWNLFHAWLHCWLANGCNWLKQYNIYVVTNSRGCFTVLSPLLLWWISSPWNVFGWFLMIFPGGIWTRMWTAIYQVPVGYAIPQMLNVWCIYLHLPQRLP